MSDVIVSQDIDTFMQAADAASALRTLNGLAVNASLTALASTSANAVPRYQVLAGPSNPFITSAPASFRALTITDVPSSILYETNSIPGPYTPTNTPCLVSVDNQSRKILNYNTTEYLALLGIGPTSITKANIAANTLSASNITTNTLYASGGLIRGNFEITNNVSISGGITVTGESSLISQVVLQDKLFWNKYSGNEPSVRTESISGSDDGRLVLDGPVSIYKYTAQPFDDTLFIEGKTVTTSLSTQSLSASIVTLNKLKFNTSYTGTVLPGELIWNDADGTLDLKLKGNNVTLQIGQEEVVRVVNNTGADLLESQYRVCRVSSAQGQRLAVNLAIATNDANSASTLGIVTENIANNQEGFITISGMVRGINTTGSLQGETWVDGDVLYLSPTTPGGITKVKPVAPFHTVILGYVVYSHNNNGKIFVKIDNGYELEELHNVRVTNLSSNDILSYNTVSGIWVNNPLSAIPINVNSLTAKEVISDVNITNITTNKTFSYPADNSKIFNFNTSSGNISAIFPSNLPNGFNIGITNIGTNTVFISSTQVNNLCATSNKNNTIYSGMYIYKANNSLFGVGRFN